jgi:hypothetical protein
MIAGRRLATGRRVVAAVTISLAALLGASVGRFGAAAAGVVPLVLGAMGLVALTQYVGPDDDSELRRLMTWTLGAFVAHFFIGVAIMSSSTATTYLGPDAVTYHTTAGWLVERWHGAPWGVHLPAGKEGFFYMLAALYYVFGAHPVAGLAVNAVLSAALVPLGFDVTRRLFGAPATRFVAPLFVVLPGLLVWTSQLLREAPTLFLLMVAVACAVRIAHRPSATTVLTLSVAVVLLFTFRATVALAASGALVAALALGQRRVVSAIGTGIALVGLTLTLIFAARVGYSGYTVTSKANLRQVNVARRSLGTANSGYGSDASVNSRGKALSFLPKGVLYFLVGPFPWQVHGARQLPALGDAVCLWALIPSLARGIAAGRRAAGRALLVLLLPAGAIAITLALFLGNFGTVVRERLQVLIFLLPFVALGLSLRYDAATDGPAEQPALVDLA